MINKNSRWRMAISLVILAPLGLASVAGAQIQPQASACSETVQASVVAFDQVYSWNRLGAVQPHGMIYALLRDVEAIQSSSRPGPGNVQLREGKRPRPIVLRVNAGQCLQINFYNWLSPTRADNEQVATRDASVHVVGMQVVSSINDDGSYVGQNSSGLVSPGGSRTYTLYAEAEGTFLLQNGGSLIGGEGDNGTISAGLFGAVNVQPKNSVWYRSQVTKQELDWATSGQSPDGHPLIKYGATYPAGHKFAGKPILEILSGNEIFHSDLTAIIAGKDPSGLILPNPYAGKEVYVSPNRNEPFREFTIIFHDEIAAVQAFPEFNHEVLNHTLHSVRDAFAINYGTGGIGAEILANRLGVGPMHDCTECLYEEFFLSAWAVGDPAMVVDKPASYPCSTSQLKTEYSDINNPPCTPQPGVKATKAFFPDDPSNVYHSYMNDHVKFRNLLAGSDDHHIFHLHAHQWLHTPNSDQSTYLDSQAIGQGTGFTYEIAHEGSGNRNKTPGDSIFHCHFYPHFAQGMWAMWRTHDVFEEGTQLDSNGRPVNYITQNGVVVPTRALPDGEIVYGTPIPAIVPLPGQAMPPMPSPVGLVNGQVAMNPPTGSEFPGYPFYIPGIAGHRPPHPPLDFHVDSGGVVHDGGLPRHLITDGIFFEEHTRLSFKKNLLTADAILLEEDGEPWEEQAMGFHGDKFDGTQDGFIQTYDTLGNAVKWEVNGAPAVGGAPYADPCLGGSTTPEPQRFLTYKAANIEMDVVFNKEGWHFPQQRFISLWEDVDSFLNQGKPPEPFFFRGNTYDCIEYLHTNLVPKIYELDDFQVRTPTDILGQHIHLVKFDVTSSDGGGNGFNYEDGTFSPEEVVERIHAINQLGGIYDPMAGARKILQAKYHPNFSNNPDWLGAQTTIQRWYVDEVLNHGSYSDPQRDRTLRTVFTHDHFGPSTHQQTGLYAGLVVEPFGSSWYHNESGVPLYTRPDGGPTTWQAVIEGATERETFREFLLEFGDFQHAYTKDSPASPDPIMGWADPKTAINPPGRAQYWDRLLTDKPWIYEKPFFDECPGGVPAPCPEAVSADDPGTMVVNYRNEPIGLRVWDPSSNTQSTGAAGDLSHVYRSNITRKLTSLNSQPAGSQLTQDVEPRDPFTPLIRAYEQDRVQVRILVGSHEEEHNFSVNGVRWLFEPEDEDSGFRNSQMMGISEHYEFEIPQLPKSGPHTRGSVDFLYKAGSSVDDQWNGLWGIVRAYKNQSADLRALSTNPPGSSPDMGASGKFKGVCPREAPQKSFDISAVAVSQLLPNRTLIYNRRGTTMEDCQYIPPPYPGGPESFSCSPTNLTGPLHDPTGLMYVMTSDLVASGIDTNGQTLYNLTSGIFEPLVLRANAGDCIEVRLRNKLPEKLRNDRGYSLVPNVIDKFNANQVAPSHKVGLHAQLVTYDVTISDGMNVGFNKVQTVNPGASRLYQMYAGQITYDPATNSYDAIPTEFGAINLTSSDPIKHVNKNLMGALIIEPQHAIWTEDPGTRAAATVSVEDTGEEFREFVVVFQNDINLQYKNGTPVMLTPMMEDPAETGQDGLNYRTEPVWFREAYLPETDPGVTRQFDDLHDAFSNVTTGGLDPETPVFTAANGQDVRFRVIHPGGHSQNHAFAVHGHIWQETPYTNNSTKLGNNMFSELKGAQFGHGASNHFDALMQNGAGGMYARSGDYMYRDQVPWYLANGIWGILRVATPWQPWDPPLYPYNPIPIDAN